MVKEVFNTHDSTFNLINGSTQLISGEGKQNF